MLRALLSHPSVARAGATTRALTTTALQRVKAMPRRPAAIPEEEFTEAFLCGTGPGGQKIVSAVPVRIQERFADSCPLEQNVLRSPAQASADGHRPQSSGDAVADAESEDSAADAGGEGGAAGEGAAEPGGYRWGGEEEEEEQRE